MRETEATASFAAILTVPVNAECDPDYDKHTDPWRWANWISAWVLQPHKTRQYLVEQNFNRELERFGESKIGVGEELNQAEIPVDYTSAGCTASVAMRALASRVSLRFWWFGSAEVAENGNLQRIGGLGFKLAAAGALMGADLVEEWGELIVRATDGTPIAPVVIADGQDVAAAIDEYATLRKTHQWNLSIELDQKNGTVTVRYASSSEKLASLDLLVAKTDQDALRMVREWGRAHGRDVDPPSSERPTEPSSEPEARSRLSGSARTQLLPALTFVLVFLVLVLLLAGRRDTPNPYGPDAGLAHPDADASDSRADDFGIDDEDAGSSSGHATGPDARRQLSARKAHEVINWGDSGANDALPRPDAARYRRCAARGDPIDVHTQRAVDVRAMLTEYGIAALAANVCGGDYSVDVVDAQDQGKHQLQICCQGMSLDGLSQSTPMSTAASLRGLLEDQRESARSR